MNTGASWPSLDEAKARVLGIQTKLHRWAGEDEGRRFDDLFNLVADPAFLVVAWNRVRTNRGARTAGVDGETTHYVGARGNMCCWLRTPEPWPSPGYLGRAPEGGERDRHHRTVLAERANSNHDPTPVQFAMSATDHRRLSTVGVLRG